MPHTPPHAPADYDFERAFRKVLTFTPRRPGWRGGLDPTSLIIRAFLVIPVLLVFAFLQLGAQVIQALAGVALWLGAVALLLGLGYIFLTALLPACASLEEHTPRQARAREEWRQCEAAPNAGT